MTLEEKEEAFLKKFKAQPQKQVYIPKRPSKSDIFAQEDDDEDDIDDDELQAQLDIYDAKKMGHTVVYDGGDLIDLS
jgi:hypothetical protein